MNLTTIVGLAGFVALAVALTGVVVNKDGKVSFLVKSLLIRATCGILGTTAVALSIYMWKSALPVIADQRVPGLELRLTDLSGKLDQLQTDLNGTIAIAHTDSINSLIRVAQLIGKHSELGCRRSLSYYQSNHQFDPNDQDICNRLLRLMHPVTYLVDVNDPDLERLRKSFADEGIPFFTGSSKSSIAAHNKSLTIFYPDDADRNILCTVHDLVEAAAPIDVERRPFIEYALSIKRLAEVKRSQMTWSNQVILVGDDHSKYVTGLEPISTKEWLYICGSGATERRFENLMRSKAKNIEVVVPIHAEP